jgi:hypothetical protein
MIDRTIAYSWVELAASGISVVMGDDESRGPFPIGFSFSFYGSSYSDFYVSSNGVITFGSGSSDFGNDCIPNPGTPNNVIALHWDDLNPGGSRPVYYRSYAACPVGRGRCLVVQYDDIPYYGVGVAGTFEGILYENGSIRFQYQDAGSRAGSSATVGIENMLGTEGVQFSCDTPSLTPSLAFCIVAPGSTGC